MLLYIDDVLGRLFDAVAASGLADSTYILLTADNGPGLPKAFLKDKMQRLVSVDLALDSLLWLLPASLEKPTETSAG
jgi:arylsulfatase A-like enzyme